MTTAEVAVGLGSQFRLDGRTAVVTGASSGLGRQFARVLAGAGATVYAVARRGDRLDSLADSTPGVVGLACDVSDATERRRLVETVSHDAGRVDVLVNNAGVSGEQHLAEATSEVVRDVLEVNLVAALDLARMVSDQPDVEGVSVVNVASILGLVAGHPLGGASYAASKGGLIAVTRELAAQVGHRGMRVNALAPGWFATEMTEDLFANEKAARFVERNTLLNRAGRGEELDGALLLLASRAGSYITGQTIVVDGGWTAR